MKSLKYILVELGSISQPAVSQKYISALENTVKPCGTFHSKGNTINGPFCSACLVQKNAKFLHKVRSV